MATAVRCPQRRRLALPPDPLRAGPAAGDARLATDLHDDCRPRRPRCPTGEVSPEHASVIATPPPSCRRASRATSGHGRADTGREGAAARPPAAAPRRPPSAGCGRARRLGRRRPRGRPAPGRGGRRPRPDPAHPPRPRRRHHVRSLHRPDPGRLDPAQGPRRDDLSPTGTARRHAVQAGRPRVDRDRAHDRGLAFTDLLEHLPTDRLHGKVAATVVVTLDLDTLRGRLRPPASTPATWSPPPKPAGSPATRASSPPSSTAGRSRSTSAGPAGCSPRRNASPAPPATPAAPPTAARRRTPGASSTTDSPGITAGGPTWATWSRCAGSTTAGSTTRRSPPTKARRGRHVPSEDVVPSRWREGGRLVSGPGTPPRATTRAGPASTLASISSGVSRGPSSHVRAPPRGRRRCATVTAVKP